MKKHSTPTRFWLCLLALATVTAVAAVGWPDDTGAEKTKPLRVLMITGGCCHDYEAQKRILAEELADRVNVSVKIVHEGGKSTDHTPSPFLEKNWTRGYDVVLHNECFARIPDENVGKSVAREHHDTGVGAVMIHCAMHTFRDMKSDDWRKLIGMTSKRHGKKLPIKVTFKEPNHPILRGIKEFTTGKEELYQSIKLWDTATALATGANSSDREPDQPVIWINRYGKARVFGTTLGHYNETLQRDDVLDIIARGLLWACGKLDEDGDPLPGYGPVK